MSVEIALTLLIVLITAVLFITEWVRADVVALLILVTLAVTGLVAPEDALAGFSSPAVITVWAMFIISGGMAATGVANAIGDQLLKVAGDGELRLLLLISFTAAFLSAFMNNVGVAALMLPVVMSIARERRIPPSRLLMPLAFACLLGGLTTLIGTPPNILVSDALRTAGYGRFGMFDFALVGVPLMIVGILFMGITSRYLLPKRNVEAETAVTTEASMSDERYQIDDALFSIQLAADSSLVGKTLAESLIGDVLGVNIIAIKRNGELLLAPEPTTVFQIKDQLFLVGHPKQIDRLQNYQFELEPTRVSAKQLTNIETAVFTLLPHSNLVNKSLAALEFRDRFGVNVLAIERDRQLFHRDLAQEILQIGDALIVQGSHAQMTQFDQLSDFEQTIRETAEFLQMGENVLLLRVPAKSSLVGQTLEESRIGELFHFNVLGRLKENQLDPIASAEVVLQPNDMLLVQGRADDVATIMEFATLQVEQAPLTMNELESDQIGLVQATLSPYTNAAGKTLQDLHFREKFGLTVVAIWRNGRALRHDLADIPLQLGDGLLLHGPRSLLDVFTAEPDFVLLESSIQPKLKTQKMPVALFIMVLVLLPVLFNWLPIAITAVMGAALMVITGCLTMDDAYRQIEWRAVFLIAGMIPLGIALETTGASDLVAKRLIQLAAPYGVVAILATLYLVTNVASQIMPSAVVVVLMVPIALNTAVDLNMSPEAILMTIAIAASLSLLSPVGHPANVMVMGPGGYKFKDYVRYGLPLSLLLFLLCVFLLPLLWPLY